MKPLFCIIARPLRPSTKRVLSRQKDQSLREFEIIKSTIYFYDCKTSGDVVYHHGHAVMPFYGIGQFHPGGYGHSNYYQGGFMQERDALHKLARVAFVVSINRDGFQLAIIGEIPAIPANHERHN